MSKRLIRSLLAWVVVAAAVVGLPHLLTSSYYQNIAILALLYAVVASNWDLTLGYLGLFNFAHVAFFGLGAYTAGILTTKYAMSPWLALLAAMGLTAVVGGAVSFPAVRLRGIYVALTTFAFAQLVLSLIVSRASLTGGSAGLVLIPPLTIRHYDFSVHTVGYFYAAEVLLLGSTVFLRLLVRSNVGLSFMAIREFEEYAAARGVPVARQRVVAVVGSAVFTGAAGAIYAYYLSVTSPDLFGFSFISLFLSMVILGGAGTLYGPICAAVALTFFTESRQVAGLGEFRFILISGLIILVLLFARTGFWGALRTLGGRISETRSGAALLRAVGMDSDGERPDTASPL